MSHTLQTTRLCALNVPLFEACSSKIGIALALKWILLYCSNKTNIPSFRSLVSPWDILRATPTCLEMLHFVIHVYISKYCHRLIVSVLSLWELYMWFSRFYDSPTYYKPYIAKNTLLDQRMSRMMAGKKADQMLKTVMMYRKNYVLLLAS